MASKYRKKEEANTRLTLEAISTLLEKHCEVPEIVWSSWFEIGLTRANGCCRGPQSVMDLENICSTLCSDNTKLK